MSLSCDLTGHQWLNGNKVSHSNRKSKRRFLPNLHNSTLCSDSLSQKFRFKVSNKTLRTIDFKGGFDEFLLNTKNAKLTKTALKLKKLILKKTSSTINASSKEAKN
jgi:large subunit ribosomal protein L28